jgi:hypothetical protein
MSGAFAALNLSMAQLPLGHGSNFTQPSLVVPMFVSFRADKQQKEIISRSRNRLRVMIFSPKYKLLKQKCEEVS